MADIETLSRYLNELLKEKKYQNVLVNFKNNSSDFLKHEIRANAYLVKAVLDAFRHEKLYDGANEFVQQYEIEIGSSQNKIILNSYGWLLYNQLGDKIANGQVSEISQLLSEINVFIGHLDLSDEYYDMLISFLLKKATSVRKISPQVAVEQIIKFLETIKIKTNVRIKNLIKNDVFIVAGVASCFGKAGFPDRGLKFLNYLGIDVSASDASDEVLNTYGWLLYYKLKEDNKDVDDEEPEKEIDTMFIDFENPNEENKSEDFLLDKEQVYEDILRIIPRLKIESTYSPFSRLFNLYLKIEKKKPNTNWAKILGMLEVMDVKSLSVECKTVTFTKNGRNKSAELASDKEIWYASYSAALFRLKNFQKCLEISEEAFEIIPKFHYNNDIWFSRKISLCKKELGDITEAIKGLEEIVNKKPEWFIQKEIAELYFECGNILLAKKLALTAALNRFEIEKKDGLFLLLGKIFLKEGDKTMAHKHFLLALLIRQELQYKIPQILKSLLSESKSNDQEFNYGHTEILYRELQSFWKSLLPRDKKFESNNQNSKQKGKISKLISTKNIGFILGDSGHEYFFHFNDFKDKNLAPGIKVVFKFKRPDSPDKKWIAFEIKADN